MMDHLFLLSAAPAIRASRVNVIILHLIIAPKCLAFLSLHPHHSRHAVWSPNLGRWKNGDFDAYGPNDGRSTAANI